MEVAKALPATFLILGNISQLVVGGSSNNKEQGCYHDLQNSGIKDVTDVLVLHNYLRSLVIDGKVPGQPAARSMKKMVWDKQLADKALELAEECVFKHKSAEDDRFTTGQSLHIKCSTEPNIRTNWTEPIISWFNEYEQYKTYPNITSETVQAAGHYTQLVWADTEYVGCAYSLFKIRPNDNAPKNDIIQNMARQKMEFCKLYVCNYGPGGNIVGSSPYQPK